VPAHVPGVADSLLSPRSTWPDADAYDRKAAELAGMFRANFATLSDEAPGRAERGAPPAP
jgi:phosphoenolpyruvate carboxykinase (ATP)